MKPAILIGHLKNIGNENNLIRTAEAFGINLVMVMGKRNKYSAQGAEKHMIYLSFKNDLEFIKYCAENNHNLVCIENIKEATPISKIEKYPVNPVFITGHENTGVPNWLLKMASLVIQIPQAKTYVRCLNTSTACAIVIQDWFNKNGRHI